MTKKTKSSKAWNWFMTTLFTLILLLVLVDAGSRAFFDFELVRWMAFGNDTFTRVILAIAGIIGFIALINLVITKVYSIIKS